MKSKRWTKEEDELLRELAGECSAEELARKLDRTLDGIWSRMSHLHIRGMGRVPLKAEARYMQEYGVCVHAVRAIGLSRLPLMGEEARAFMLRTWDRELKEQKMVRPTRSKKIEGAQVEKQARTPPSPVTAPVTRPVVVPFVDPIARMLELAKRCA